MDGKKRLPVVPSASDDPSCTSRRGFLKLMGQTGAVALLTSCDAETRERFFATHFRELSKDAVERLCRRLEREYREKYGVDFKVGAEPPIPGVTFAYALNLSRCIGCRRCVYACVEENNQSRNPQVHYIKVLEMDKERGVDLTHANAYYEAEEVPRPGHFYFPAACQQCDHSPCEKVCPVGATWKEPDGVVTIDYEWCIGCRYCMAACPYDARRFNWAEPSIPKDQLNPNTHILGNRPRRKGVVEKCHWCLHRVRNGRYPACLEVCPVGARKFGNLLDPDGEIRKVLETKRVFVFKEELDTKPKFFYFYGE
ncbi:MAG: 4Fe-4S dicluster domain-containing protein [Deltaproteobacteria bacterium]|nr:4Fe-4S dicluster domain-containing protein [Deltaproteobacteria bacterium]